MVRRPLGAATLPSEDALELHHRALDLLGEDAVYLGLIVEADDGASRRNPTPCRPAEVGVPLKTFRISWCSSLGLVVSSGHPRQPSPWRRRLLLLLRLDRVGALTA